MFGEEKYFLDLSRKLLDMYTIDELLYELDLDPVDFLADLIMTGQLNVDSLIDQMDHDEEA